MHAPTAHNSQQIQWLVVNSKEKVRALAGLAVEFMEYLIREKNPLVAVYHLDRAVEAWDAGLDPVNRGAGALVVAYAPKSYMFAQVDATIALTFLDLAAPSLGLGTCWAGGLTTTAMHWPPLLQALAIPDEQAICGAMLLGYPKHQYHRLPLRKQPAVAWQ